MGDWFGLAAVAALGFVVGRWAITARAIYGRAAAGLLFAAFLLLGSNQNRAALLVGLAIAGVVWAIQSRQLSQKQRQ